MGADSINIFCPEILGLIFQKDFHFCKLGVRYLQRLPYTHAPEHDLYVPITPSTRPKIALTLSNIHLHTSSKYSKTTF